MRNTFLRDRTARDIDAQVGKILKDLGNPEPPLSLADVRELLRLDRRYYSTTSTGPLTESVHKLTLAGKQVLARPTVLLDVVKKCSLKALFLPDRKRILIDSDQPTPKQRWAEAHEIGHGIIPWHQGMMLGDDRLTLKPACHEQLEAEANFAAGRLLFLQDRLITEVRGSALNLERVRSLGSSFGNTMTTTLWRVVEQLDIPAFGIICDHPHRPSPDFNPTDPCRYFIRSKPFDAQFATVSEVDLFLHIQGYCSAASGGPLGEADLLLKDVNGLDHLFHCETFFNRYEALTLASYSQPRASIVQA